MLQNLAEERKYQYDVRDSVTMERAPKALAPCM